MNRPQEIRDRTIHMPVLGPDLSPRKDRERIPTLWKGIMGAPSSGKSASIKDMAPFAENHVVIPEAAARAIADMNEEARLGKRQPIVWTNENRRKLSIEVSHRSVIIIEEDERKLHPLQPAIRDRTRRDVKGYATYDEEGDYSYVEDGDVFELEMVFFFHSLGTYQQDGVRYEDIEFARAIEVHLLTSYRQAGYRPIDVPQFPNIEGRYETPRDAEFASRMQRAQFVLGHIGINPHPVYLARHILSNMKEEQEERERKKAEAKAQAL